MSRLGLIADTHGHLPPSVLRGFAGVEHILHAGDVGRPAILAELERVAPVTAVLGNTDSDPMWRETEVIEFDSVRCLLRHIVDPDHLGRDLESQLRRVRPDVVVFGHTHRPFCDRRDGRLFVNPGSASRPRGGSHHSAAILRLEPGGPFVEFIRL